MRIESSQPNFGHKIKTINVLETTTLKIIESAGVQELKYIIDTFTPIKATGWQGYKHFLNKIGTRIMEKYPEVAEATNDLKSYIKQYPDATKKDIRAYAEKHIQKLGETLDIEI